MCNEAIQWFWLFLVNVERNLPALKSWLLCISHQVAAPHQWVCFLSHERKGDHVDHFHDVKHTWVSKIKLVHGSKGKNTTHVYCWIWHRKLRHMDCYMISLGCYLIFVYCTIIWYKNITFQTPAEIFGTRTFGCKLSLQFYLCFPTLNGSQNSVNYMCEKCYQCMFFVESDR